MERAAELGKRLIPVQGALAAEADVPERLRRLNYIYFRAGQSFARPLSELATALRQDVAWIREHTRLSEAAARWQARSRAGGAASDLLLRGGDLADAKTWAARRQENAPEISTLIQSFLDASEANALTLAEEERQRLAERERLVAERERAQHSVRRVQRRWAAALAGVTLAVIVGTGLGLWAVFEGWRGVMLNRSQFLAGLTDQQAGRGDYVTAMLIGVEALPDAASDSIRQRMMKVEMSAVNALDGAWRGWSSEWRERTVLGGHTASVSAVAFSPDGSRVLTGSADNTARLWDAATGKAVATLSGHTDGTWAVAFSPTAALLTGSPIARRGCGTRPPAGSATLRDTRVGFARRVLARRLARADWLVGRAARLGDAATGKECDAQATRAGIWPWRSRPTARLRRAGRGDGRCCGTRAPAGLSRR